MANRLSASIVTLLLLLLINFQAVSADVDPIIIKGSHFFYKTNGTEFFIKGIAYQQDITDIVAETAGLFIDPLADTASCDRDIPVLKELGINVIRVYAVDNTKPSGSHDECMNLLAGAGIYVLVDLSTPSESIDRNNPTWNLELYNSYTATIDVMAGYSNLLGFFVGNGVSNSPSTSLASAAVKAAVRDAKAYIKKQNYRAIGVGYATYDDADIRTAQQAYFNCGEPEGSVDFYGLNSFAWCGDSTFTKSGYSQLTAQFSGYNVPVFFAEYGCNVVQPRTFSEVTAIYGSQMVGTFRGGIAYQYFEDSTNYGVVNVSGGSETRLADYTALSTQLASASPSLTVAADYTASNSAEACPTTDSSWSASPTLPPTPYSDLCNCMYNSLECVASKVYNTSSTSSVLSQLCGLGTNCEGVSSNSSTGVYGAYSMCNLTQQVSWVMNNYYISQNKAASKCDYDGSGNGVLKDAGETSTKCQALFAQAKSDGTGTITSSVTFGTGGSSPTKKTSSSSTDSDGQPTDTSGGAAGAKKHKGGLSTGAIAGIAVGVVVLAILAAILAFFCWRRRKPKGPPESGDGGLEVGPAPPQYTALKRAELEAGRGQYHEVKTDDPGHLSNGHVHNIPTMMGGVGVEELSAEPQRRELDASTGGATHAELSAGDERQQTNIGASNSHRLRKPVGGSAPKAVSPSQTQQHQPAASSSWVNSPWTDPGLGQEASSQAQAEHPALPQEAAPQIPPLAAVHSTETPSSPVETDELLRMQEEERRIDEAIAESERLQALRKEKEELQRRMLEARAKNSRRDEGG